MISSRRLVLIVREVFGSGRPGLPPDDQLMGSCVDRPGGKRAGFRTDDQHGWALRLLPPAGGVVGLRAAVVVLPPLEGVVDAGWFVAVGHERAVGVGRPPHPPHWVHPPP